MVVLIAFGFLFFLWFVNGLLLQYQRTAVEAALVDGARQGARVGADPAAVVDACERSVTTALQSTLQGSVTRGEVRSVVCSFAPGSEGTSGRVTASAQVRFRTLVAAPAAISPVPVEDELTATIQRRVPGGDQ